MASTVAWWLVAFLALARLAPVLALDSASSTSLAFRNDLGRVVNLTVTVPPSSEPVATIARLTEGALSDAVTLSLPLNATSLTVKPILTFLDTGERIILAPKEVSLGHAQGVLAYRHALVSWLLVDHSPITLKLDTTLVRLALFDHNVSVLGVSSECYKCNLQSLWPPCSVAAASPQFTVNTDYPVHLQVHLSNGSVLPRETIKFISQGEYTLIVDNDAFSLYLDHGDADAFWKPPVVALISIIGLIALSITIAKIAPRIPLISSMFHKKEASLLSEVERQVQSASVPKIKQRVVALDAFRGFTLTWMVFVNYGAGGYWFLDHALWNGLTPADLLFPWFVFIMGTAMALSFRFLDRAEHVHKGPILYRIVRRSIILVSLGLFFNNFHDLSTGRFPGVLQRLGLSYLFCGLILLYVPVLRRFLPGAETRFRVVTVMKDVLPYLLQWITVFAILGVYLILQFCLPVPGCPLGYIGPGGIGDYGRYPNCTGGAHGYIDKMLFGERHIYQSPTCADIYKTGAYDPEGALGLLTSIVLCFIGVQAGRILAFADPRARIKRWLSWHIVCGLLALALTEGTQNEGWIPINKNLWSPSFILATGSLAFLLLTLFFMLIDVTSVWSGAPFTFVGMNSILIYCTHGLLHRFFPFSFASDGSHAMLLLSALIGTALWIIIAFRMHQLKFYVSI